MAYPLEALLPPAYELRAARNEPKVWFTTTESFAKVLSAGNRDLLRVIEEQAPSSLDELARITGKAKSNLSRTLKTMAGYGLVRLERGERGRITPKVTPWSSRSLFPGSCEISTLAVTACNSFTNQAAVSFAQFNA